MPLQSMRASDRLPSGMNYHRFITEGKGKENNRFSQEKRGKFYQNYNISRFSGSKTGNYSPFIRLFIRLCFVLMTERAPDAHAPEAPESFNL